tara:strand:- start:1989 stop:2411 length:423 start_codon:yes stop_codon:yes gene_type:complete
MPGTPTEYLSDPSTREAETLMDQLITQGASGSSIIDALESAGLRIYNSDDIEEYEEPGEEIDAEAATGTGEIGAEEPEEDGEEEGEYEDGPMYDEELDAAGPGPAMVGGDEGGNRALIIEAVRFGVDEDKKKKSKTKKFD